jgi:hypothetical protein
MTPMGLKVCTVLRQIINDIKEIAKIRGNIDENVFLQYCEKLWNTTNINEPKLEWHFSNHIGTFITSNQVEEGLKVTKNGKSPGEDNIKSEFYNYAPKEFKLRLLQFLSHVYTKNYIGYQTNGEMRL